MDAETAGRIGDALHYAALSVAAREASAGKVIVVLLADTGERYITSELFVGK